MPPQRVALALGSGGARGYAHIGAIEEVLSRGHEIVAIAGSSMGALVGALAGAGRMEAYAEWARALTQRDVLRMLDPKWSAPGALGARRVIREVEELLGDRLIEDLSFPFTAVATDLTHRREVWFQAGPVVPAIRASISIPGLFTPVEMNGRVLVDGGVLNPVPIEPTAAAAPDLTIAVALQGARVPEDRSAPARESAEPVWRELVGRVRRGVGRGTAPPEHTAPPGPLDDVHISDVVSMSMDAMQGLITRYRAAGLPPDVLVTVPVGAGRSMDYHRADAIIEMGRRLTADALDAAGH